MRGIDNFDDDTGSTVFRDVFMLALVGFVVIVLLLLPHLNPPAEAAKQPVNPPGNVVVEARWPDALDSDIDLWVQAPGDVPVGYSNRGGDIFNLLRDDRGHLNDASDLNYEVSYSRGIPGGEYTVNLHFYSSRSEITAPVRVKLVVSVKQDDDAPAQQIVASEVSLRLCDVITALGFKRNDRG